MNPKYELYEKIDRYINHTLSEQELAEFNEQLAGDETLRETVEAQQFANDLIIDEELMQLKERMRTDMKGSGNSGFSNSAKFVLVSVFAITSAAFIYFFTQQNSEANDNIADKKSKQVSEEMSSSEKNSQVSSSEKTKNIGANTATPSDKKVSTKEKVATPVSNEQSQNSITENSIVPHKATNPAEQKTIFSDPEINTEKAVVNCNEVKIEANAHIQYGINETEATIVVDKKTIQGGTAPYQLSLDKETFSSDFRFENLQEGVHHIFVKDQNNCISEIKKVTIKYPEKTIDEAFNPSQGEKWNFPLNGKQDGTITIQNKAGQIIYSKTIQGGYPSEWYGLDNNGNELDAGNYVFIINFTDQTIVKGHISIYK